MAEHTEDGLSPRERYLNLLFDMLRQNEAFLYENAQELYIEIVALENDAIDHIGGWSRSEVGPEDYVKTAMRYFLLHVLFPVSGAIHLNALAGNLPGCYSALRLALESLVKCYLADMRYPDQDFFRDKICLLEEQPNRRRKSTTSFMEEWDKHLGRKDGSAALWKELSQTWVHARGVMEGITNRIIQQIDAPAWGMVLPQAYTMGGMTALNELQRKLSQFRSLLRDAMRPTGP
jgi:hypothetical protein